MALQKPLWVRVMKVWKLYSYSAVKGNCLFFSKLGLSIIKHSTQIISNQIITRRNTGSSRASNGFSGHNGWNACRMWRTPHGYNPPVARFRHEDGAARTEGLQKADADATIVRHCMFSLYCTLATVCRTEEPPV